MTGADPIPRDAEDRARRTRRKRGPLLRRFARQPNFRAEPVGDPRQEQDPEAAARMRLRRDQVRLRVDPVVLEVLWEVWRSVMGGPVWPFHRVVDEEAPRYARRVGRVVRALSNVQVGVAVSGGGACAFRAGPLLDQLRNLHVPVDVYAGVSGGALVGAYYCAQGVRGVQRIIAQGGALKRVLPLLAISSYPLEALVDLDLDGRRVEDLTPTFAAITTELGSAERPRAVAVTHGTLGEAVRASGCLPVGFGPTEKNGKRYADGATAALIPVQMLVQLGADVTLGCNAVPGPNSSNPWHDRFVARGIRRLTPVGRLMDAWTTFAFLMQRSSRRFGGMADVYVSFPPDEIPLLEMTQWGEGADIVAQARACETLGDKAQELADAWLRLHR